MNENIEDNNIETKWCSLKKCLSLEASKSIGKVENEKRKEWFSNECKEIVR